MPDYRNIPLEQRLWGLVEVNEFGCWLRTLWKKRTGYSQVRLTHGVQHQAHRVAYELTYGPIPNGFDVLHTCSVFYPPSDITNRRCINPAHLKLGNDFDNQRQGVEEGRAAMGERNFLAKLTEEIVRECRQRYPVETIASLAREKNVTPQAMRVAILRQTWRHVQ